jgi:hypothetical protein
MEIMIESIRLIGYKTSKLYPKELRLVKYCDFETGEELDFITNITGQVEPIGGLLVLLLATWVTSIMPYMLSFAAGAMLYVVIEELIPEASQGKHSNINTIGFAIGFVLMMVLDVVMG